MPSLAVEQVGLVEQSAPVSQRDRRQHPGAGGTRQDELSPFLITWPVLKAEPIRTVATPKVRPGSSRGGCLGHADPSLVTRATRGRTCCGTPLRVSGSGSALGGSGHVICTVTGLLIGPLEKCLARIVSSRP